MVQAKRIPKATMPNIPSFPLPGGDAAGTKWLIAAILAAGKDSCDCPSCQLLKRFGSALSEVMLKEGEGGGD